MDNLGPVFRDFRLNGHYSLKEAAGEVCSTSQLSRFELGESDMTLSKFLDLLDNIHVTFENFMDKARNFQLNDHIAMMSQIIPLYYSKDIEGFQKLQAKQLEKAKEDSSPLYYELNWILLQGLICQRDSRFSMEQADLDKVADYLFQVEDWTMYELILFGNLYTFYEVDYVYRMAKEVLKNKCLFMQIGRQRNLVRLLLLNFWLHCLEHGDLNKATYFEDQVKIFLEDPTAIYEKTIFVYIKGFKLYIEGDKQVGINKMCDAIQVFEVVGAAQQVEYYKEHFNKFVRRT
ncbi:MutR family transcriptional regulator [Streptococcus sanguinis]|uniref:MutR family transcriptional regulator n=1 Tax=Streptococcus sanguinis TaxID=1305 RepID=A0A7H8V7K8_STRSA|nr:MutR family transcriptional regulator [Streptococcus sanguinis]